MPAAVTKSNKIGLLYTDVGRGHPFYLDGVMETLERLGDRRLQPQPTTVFELSHGLSSIAWHTAQWLYRKGSSGGAIGRLYARLRDGADYNRPGLSLRLLGRDIRGKYLNESHPLVLAHPTLVGILRGRKNLIYQHGEIAVPPEAVVAGAEFVLVPTESAARPFVAAGYSSQQVRVTGLCIEPSLRDLAQISYHRRQKRLAAEGPLTGLYVSSGAEPVQHVAAIIESVASCCESGGRAVILARSGGRLHRRIVDRLSELAIDYVCLRSSEDAVRADSEIVLALYDFRKTENDLTAALFERVDYFVAPAHERTHWALGLGLPIFPLLPSVGPYAPLNLEALTSAGVAVPLDGNHPPSELGRMLKELRRDGLLAKMSSAGWGRHDIKGFETIARFLSDRYGG